MDRELEKLSKITFPYPVDLHHLDYLFSYLSKRTSMGVTYRTTTETTLTSVGQQTRFCELIGEFSDGTCSHPFEGTISKNPVGLKDLSFIIRPGFEVTDYLPSRTERWKLLTDAVEHYFIHNSIH